MAKSFHDRSPGMALAYSAPSILRLLDPPSALDYNAFPDLNSVDPHDYSLSAFPVHARFLLPLDSDLLLWGSWKQADELERGELSRLGLGFARRYREAYNKLGPNAQLQIPEHQSVTQAYRLEHTFELAHRALAASPDKWWLRSHALAPMYTLLEDMADQVETIEVPLSTYGTRRLNKQWHQIVADFAATRAVDEAVSLYVCLARLADPFRSLVATSWTDEEAELVEEFETVFDELRSSVPLRDNASQHVRELAAQEAVEWGRAKLSSPRSEAELQKGLTPTRRRSHSSNLELTWPHILRRDAEFPTKPLQLRNPLPVKGAARRRHSLPEAVQGLLALNALKEGRELRVYGGDVWPIYVTFELETDETNEWFIAAGASNHLVRIISEGLCHPDEVPLTYEEADIIADYVVLLESIRQQICTGVGLCCPLWEPEGCCRFRSLVLHFAAITEPSRADWPHWHLPPCLVPPDRQEQLKLERSSEDREIGT